MKVSRVVSAFIIIISGICFPGHGQKKTSVRALDEINLPQGFYIEVYVDHIPNARAMSLVPDGTLFVGSREKGNLYAITKAKKVIVLDKGLSMPFSL